MPHQPVNPLQHTAEVVVITDHLPVGVGHLLYSVPAVVVVLLLEGVGPVLKWERKSTNIFGKLRSRRNNATQKSQKSRKAVRGDTRATYFLAPAYQCRLEEIPQANAVSGRNGARHRIRQGEKMGGGESWRHLRPADARSQLRDAVVPIPPPSPFRDTR